MLLRVQINSADPQPNVSAHLTRRETYQTSQGIQPTSAKLSEVRRNAPTCAIGASYTPREALAEPPRTLRNPPGGNAICPFGRAPSVNNLQHKSPPQPSLPNVVKSPVVPFPQNSTSAMTASKKLTFNIVSALLNSASPAARAASRWKRETLLAPASVETKTLRSFEFNIESRIMEVSKLLMPSAGFYAKHFGSIKPEAGCGIVWVVATTTGAAVKCLGWPT